MMVEKIELYFVPLEVYNNKGDAGAEILEKNNEQSWNNPMSRFIIAFFYIIGMSTFDEFCIAENENQ
ncbi:MAG: hypothetical protein ACI86M_002256 [Saprospiraceae bacterium]|jgi:hypothetical protein